MAKTILIVDDSSSLRTTVRLALSRAGDAVLEAADGLAEGPFYPPQLLDAVAKLIPARGAR